MATSIPNGNLAVLTSAAAVRPVAALSAPRPRKLSPETGRAIEMLGHAIEYLADEFALDCMDRILGTGSGVHPQLRAIELLKKCNRELYLSCPEIPTLAQRVRQLLWSKKS